MIDPYGGWDTFQYDALNRLTQVTRTVGGVTEHTESYSYNAIGAVKTTFDPGSMSAVTLDDQRPRLSGGGTADAAVPNTLGGQPVTLDGGGRVTSLNGVTFSYDFRNRVTGTTYTSGADTVAESYGYDAFMRRVQRLHTETSPASSTSEFYVFDGANLVATVDQNAALKDAYLFAGVDHPLRLSRGGSSYFYELDLAGNVRRLRDASGADLGGYRSPAFGGAYPADAQTPAPAIDQALRWKGRWFENVAGGVYEVRARWWSPQMGAFRQSRRVPLSRLENDAVGVAGGRTPFGSEIRMVVAGQKPMRYGSSSMPSRWAPRKAPRKAAPGQASSSVGAALGAVLAVAAGRFA